MVGFFYHQSEIFQVQTFGTPKVYKLVKLAQNSLGPEEATFVVHGVILDKDFPPISDVRYFILYSSAISVH